jgi:hypothetical protein
MSQVENLAQASNTKDREEEAHLTMEGEEEVEEINKRTKQVSSEAIKQSMEAAT